ncbi:hypothetical protein Nans01_45740 [Nocardiopsis ansamitocini]|uniref:Uncharacterized protein n=1 Tax=Nocardiopsis ansamitocini TaxID=1670832 RepID=A0A9W6UL23_9ACTN|nr:hypothetical protein Nans01_45740 [Nocardiopsis ansamitocini]
MAWVSCQAVNGMSGKASIGGLPRVRRLLPGRASPRFGGRGDTDVGALATRRPGAGPTRSPYGGAAVLTRQRGDPTVLRHWNAVTAPSTARRTTRSRADP